MCVINRMFPRLVVNISDHKYPQNTCNTRARFLKALRCMVQRNDFVFISKQGL